MNCTPPLEKKTKKKNEQVLQMSPEEAFKKIWAHIEEDELSWVKGSVELNARHPDIIYFHQLVF